MAFWEDNHFKNKVLLNRTDIHHTAPGGCSTQMFKAAVTDTAHAVFQGKIEVAPGAAKSDARQNSRNLLLSERAVADSKPELIINTDDVMCSHGSATNLAITKN